MMLEIFNATSFVAGAFVALCGVYMGVKIARGEK
jgi:hypothetical protein